MESRRIVDLLCWTGLAGTSSRGEILFRRADDACCAIEKGSALRTRNDVLVLRVQE